jgi:RHS repeat-associated protein
MEFGGDATVGEGRIEAHGKSAVRVWALSKVSDSNGNYFTISYWEDGIGEYRPKEINYTYNVAAGMTTATRKVVFGYDENGVNRADKIPQWVGGSKILTTKLLTSVKTYAPASTSTSTPVLVRDYRLEYETGTATSRSRLKRIRECDAAGNCLPSNAQPAWQFTWQEGGNGTHQTLSHTVPNGTFRNAYKWSGDFNGDGKTDLLSDENGKLWTHLSNGDGTYAAPLQFTYASASYNNLYTWIGDFNADGLDDFLSNKNGKLYLYRTNTDGTYTLVSSLTYTSSKMEVNNLWIGDANGDGKDDVITYKNSKIYTYLSTGTGLADPPLEYNIGNSGWFAGSFTRLGDFNGDGLIDIFSRNSGWGNTYINLGNGQFQLFRASTSGVMTDYTMVMGDYNGDGKTDIVSIGSSGTSIHTHFSKGDGTFEVVTYAVPPPLFINAFDTVFAGDYNGDGKADLFTLADESVGQYVYTFFSKGDGTYTPFTQTTTLFAQLNAELGDFKGDGKDSVVSFSNSQIKTHAYLGAYPDLTTQIVNPFGGTNDLTYKPLTDPSVYLKHTDNACPAAENPCYSTKHLQYPLYVVSKLLVKDGLENWGSDPDHVYTRDYNYEGARAHHWGRGGLGFRVMIEVDVSANAKTKTFYNQFFPKTGLPESIEYDRTDGVPFKETIHDYWDEGAYSGVPTLRFVAPKSVNILEWDGSMTQYRTIRREFWYDSAATGNLSRTLHSGDLGNANDQRDEVTQWIPVDPTAWLHRAKTRQLKDGSGNILREKFLYYDNQAHGVLGSFGLVTKEESNAVSGIGQPDNAVFLYTHDSASGVRTSITDPRNCTTTTVYESTKTFPSSIALCSNISAINFMMTYEYDPRHGVVKSRTAPYHVGDSPLPTTTYDYDGFGRPTKTTGPLDSSSTYGTETKQYLDWGDPGLQRVTTLRTEDHGTANVLWTEEYFDGLGRIDKVRREGPDTSVTGRTIVTDIVFDSRNLTTKRSAPYFINSSGTPQETPKLDLFNYDPLGRASQVTHADGSYATQVHERGVVTFTNERGKVTKRHFDGLEQLIKVQEFNGSSTYDTVYERDAAGSLTKVTNALGHITSIGYDLLGRKRTMCDPNMGTTPTQSACSIASPPTGAWVYTYNTAGDLLTQKDAKNQILTFTYDELGRPKTKKQGTTSISEWTYDNPAVMHSKGRVTEVRDRPVTQNTITNFWYDVLGQVIQSQRILMGTPYIMSQTYDALGRIKTETFPAPDNEIVTYNYNEAGWLKSVNNYINDVQYDARGQKTSLTYANSRVTSWTYDPNRFWIASQSTTGSQQSLSYVHDPVGNITSITDNLFTASRSFTYDDLNRLNTASGTFGVNQSPQNCSYGYNAIGNLENKCGATLSYNAAMHPSAVTHNSATNKSYLYDDNGNMTARGNQTLVWDIENRVTSVSISGGSSTNMEYDYSGMRVKKAGPNGTTLFPFKGYEIDPSNTRTKFIKIGNETFAAAKRTSSGTTTQLFYHNDHLGGVHVVTDSAGNRCQLNEYDPWGAVSRSDATNPACEPTHRFTGQELDPETGFYYYGGRYYDQETGRFVSADPYVQEPDVPQNLNRYTYVLNNPVALVDPSGHFFWIPALVSALVGAVSVAAPTLFAVEGVLTTLGVVAQATAIASNVASAAMLTAQLQKQAELSKPTADRTTQRNVDKYAQQKAPNRVSKVDPRDGSPDELGVESPAIEPLDAVLVVRGLLNTSINVLTRKAAKKLNLPDDVWNKNAPRQVQPGTRRIQHEKYNPKTGELEKSDVYYDQYGRQIGRTDHTTHGRPEIHTNPHHHSTEYSPGYSPKGKESAPIPGRFPGGEY